MRKTFIEARKARIRCQPHGRSLPLMRKTFIEAWACVGCSVVERGSLFRLCGRLSLRLKSKGASLGPSFSLFRLCGRLSLRPHRGGHGCRRVPPSLPLMRKTFIEAPAVLTWGFGGVPSLPLMRKTFIEAPAVLTWGFRGGPSLPLMRKTFIEALRPSMR